MPILLALLTIPLRKRRALAHHAELHAEHMRDLDRVDTALFVLGYWQSGSTIDNMLVALRDFKVAQERVTHLERQLSRARSRT